MKTVCFINGAFPPYLRGGAENYIINVSKELQRRGYEVCVLTTKPLNSAHSLSVEETIVEGIPVYRFAPANVASRSTFPNKNILTKGLWRFIDSVNIHSYSKIGELIEKIQPDIIHSNNLMGLSVISTKKITRSSARHIHTLHDYSLICPTGSPRTEVSHSSVNTLLNTETVVNLFASFQNLLLDTPDAITAPSQHIIDVHKKYGLFNAASCKRIPLGVREIEPIKHSKLTQELLYVGRVTERKGLDTLFAAADLRDEYYFHICGTGPYEDVVQRMAKKRSNVEYHGYVSEEKLFQLRRDVDLAVVPSIWQENSPMTIYESFSYGLPVVASDIGGIPELVEHGKNGRLFSPNNVNSLVEELDRALNDEELEEMSRNAIKWARNHTIQHHVDELTKLYNV